MLVVLWRVAPPPLLLIDRSIALLVSSIKFRCWCLLGAFDGLESWIVAASPSSAFLGGASDEFLLLGKAFLKTNASFAEIISLPSFDVTCFFCLAVHHFAFGDFCPWIFEGVSRRLSNSCDSSVALELRERRLSSCTLLMFAFFVIFLPGMKFDSAGSATVFAFTPAFAILVLSPAVVANSRSSPLGNITWSLTLVDGAVFDFVGTFLVFFALADLAVLFATSKAGVSGSTRWAAADLPIDLEGSSVIETLRFALAETAATGNFIWGLLWKEGSGVSDVLVTIFFTCLGVTGALPESRLLRRPLTVFMFTGEGTLRLPLGIEDVRFSLAVSVCRGFFGMVGFVAPGDSFGLLNFFGFFWKECIFPFSEAITTGSLVIVTIFMRDRGVCRVLRAKRQELKRSESLQVISANFDLLPL